MTLRDRLQTILDRVNQSFRSDAQPFPSDAATDHPSDGGITGEDYPQDESNREG